MISVHCRRRSVALSVCTILLSLAGFGAGQTGDKISNVSISPWQAGQPFAVEVQIVGAASVERVEIAYRSFGELSFIRKEMSIVGNSASTSIPPVASTSQFLEYYFIISERNVVVPETYPADNPEQHPFRVTLQAAGSNGESSYVTILSPEPGEGLNFSDLLISFAITGPDSVVDLSATKTYIDGADVSAGIVATGNLTIIKPENVSMSMPAGNHMIRIEVFDKKGNSIQSRIWNFFVVGTAEQGLSREKGGWLYSSALQLETRNETISSQVTPYNRASLSSSGTYDQFRILGKLYATNEESDVRQPQNRYFIGAESRWARIGYGDSNPVFPDLVMSGRRVRGLTANLTLGVFNLDFAKGDIVRRVASDILSTFAYDSLASEQARDNSAAYLPFDTAGAVKRWAKVRLGTFDRNILVIHPSFGKGDSHLGFTYMKSSDDVNSIRYGIKPQENLVIGSDLLVTLDHRKIEISGQAAFSATNKDITNGTLNDAQIDSMFTNSADSTSDRKNIRNLRDIFSKFITVNENLVPLHVKNLPTLAYEGGIAVSYFGNDLKLHYRRRGSSFESFGQTSLQTDIAGYSLFDRLRLAENRLSLTGGFERFHDNTAETKAATTRSTTMNFGVSYFPQTVLTTINAGWFLASNANDIRHDSTASIDDRTNRFLFQAGGEYKLGVSHRAELSVSTSVRDDLTSKQYNTRNTTVSIANTSTYSFPLQTTVSLMVNSSKFVTLPLNGAPKDTVISSTTVYANARYSLLEDRLLLMTTINPTFGDRERTVLDAGVQYFFLRNISAQTQLSLYLNHHADNDIIWSLILRVDV